MKVLSIKQPWASLIAHGIKDIENRTWKTNFRGRILIHASQQYACKPTEIFHLLGKDRFDALLEYIEGRHAKICERSAIIGEVDIIDCVINHPSIWAEKFIKTDSCPECGCKEFLNENLVAEGYRMCKECHQDWYVDVNYGKPIYNWVLANPVSYDTPILNVKGKLSFWEFTKPQNFK